MSNLPIWNHRLKFCRIDEYDYPVRSINGKHLIQLWKDLVYASLIVNPADFATLHPRLWFYLSTLAGYCAILKKKLIILKIENNKSVLIKKEGFKKGQLVYIEKAIPELESTGHKHEECYRLEITDDEWPMFKSQK